MTTQIKTFQIVRIVYLPKYSFVRELAAGLCQQSLKSMIRKSV